VQISQTGVLFIVSSPSGGGKTTLIKQTMERLAVHDIEGYFSVSHTTRAPRPSETDGIDYHFVDQQAFERMIHNGEFLEWAEYAGFHYGTARSEVEGRLNAGQDVFLDIEVQGAQQVKTSIPDAVKIFIYPPSYPVLKERLRQRRQDPPEAIGRRLQWALRELGVAGEFDYAIINDRLDEAVDALVGVCLAEHHRSKRMKPRLDTIREAFQDALEEDFSRE
jgi:guanylate kinase